MADTVIPSPGQELSSIDFESMIGGPLIAVVNAQAQSALTTVNFIKTVGFKQSDKGNQGQGGQGGNSSTEEPVYVSFKYQKETQPYQPKKPGTPAGPDGIPPEVPETPSVPAKYEPHELRVPILTILPIPYLRVHSKITLDINSRILSRTNLWLKNVVPSRTSTTTL